MNEMKYKNGTILLDGKEIGLVSEITFAEGRTKAPSVPMSSFFVTGVAQCPFCREPADGCECGDAREFW